MVDKDPISIDRERQSTKMEDREVVETFLTSLHHPSLRGTHDYTAHSILTIAGETSDTARLRDAQIMRERTARLRHNFPGLDDKTYDSMIDMSDAQFDAVFYRLIHALQETSKNNDMAEERQALVVLSDMRAIAHELGLHDDDTAWNNLIDILISNN